MKQAKFHWVYPADSQLSFEFEQTILEKKLPKLIGELLWQRNIRTAKELAVFLDPSLENLHDPYLLFDMEKAVKRLHAAIVAGEQILIYGDYDADGITSATVMKEALELLGAEVVVYLPNRFKDGYGPNLSVYKEYIRQGIQLILTVDNGVSGHEAIAFANEQKVDVIVTDHHELPQELPNAYAIIHPRHPNGNYPFKDLAGVGVAFKLVCALLEEIPSEFLDLVAIGTIADMVSLTDENRVLVKMGLQVLNQGGRIGLIELLSASGVKSGVVNETDIGFSIGPRLNAIGRLADANPAVELLTTFDVTEAKRLAQELDAINTERKSYVEDIYAEAMTKVNQENEVHVIVGENWHEGVLGIVAGRVMQHTGRPTLVLTIKEDGIAKGSGRSVEALNLFAMLETMRELFESFGGHHSAVGVSLKLENIEVLQQKINHYVKSNEIDLSNGVPLKIDGILDLTEISVPFVASLKVLAPFGMDNPVPKFLFEKVTAKNPRQIGGNGQHLKLLMEDDTKTQLDVVGFGFGPQVNEVASGSIDVVGQLSINEWNGNKQAQLMLDDFSVNGVQVFDFRSKRSRQLLKIPDKSLAIYFDEKLQLDIMEHCTHVHHFSDIESLNHILSESSFQQLIFLDCPKIAVTLKEVVNASQISRIYLLLLSEDDAYLDGIGSREQYGKLFKFIEMQESVDVRYKLDEISAFLKIPKKLLIFMIQVFFELKFVTINDGVLRKVTNPKSSQLTQSNLYQARMEKIKTEEFLIMSDLATLKEWLST